jgi:hypothetical protein
MSVTVEHFDDGTVPTPEAAPAPAPTPAPTVKEERNYRHNPTLHRAPGRKKGKSTYKEAINVCRSLGKKICTKKQLKQAEKDGFGEASCGWTSTGPDRHSAWTFQPVSVDVWASDGEAEAAAPRRDCMIQKIDSGLSDIYCCDPFEFRKFKYLDEEYQKAGLWLTKFEQAFHKRYHQAVPVKAKFIVYAAGASKRGLAVRKIGESSYRPVSHPKGTVPKLWPKPKPDDAKPKPGPACQLNNKPNNSTRATFLTTHKLFDIKKGDHWDGELKRDMIRYGSKIELYNNQSKKYLVVKKKTYKHLPDDNLPLIQAQARSKAAGKWVVQPTNTTDAAGGAIESGATIYLYNPRTKGRLAANKAVPVAPGSDPTEVLVTIYSDNNEISDCQWRVQVVSGNYWHSDSNIRLQHVNTGKVLEITGDKPKKKSKSSVALGEHYNHRSKWSTKLIKNKKHSSNGGAALSCAKYLNKIARVRLLAQMPGAERAAVLKSANELVDRFDKECYEIPRSAYNKTVWKLYAKIRKQLKLLMKETKLYHEYHSKEVTIQSKLQEQQKLMDQKKEELQKLREKVCKPTKKCLDGVGGEECRELEKADVEELAEKIQGLKNDDVNDHDIRNHQDISKYVKNKEIQKCV